MNVIAWHDGGPGPWILFFPLIWAVIVVGVVLLLRRTVWRGRGCGRGPWQWRAANGEHSPVAMLGRRYASGEIDEAEYRSRLAVLNEQFGPHGQDEKKSGTKGGAR
ncbi:SHOCT domain-containing protein [Streptomyces sp. H10-C2]|uniref:SHOCT domain-containing protein n=1 Tax=unclassified Streptomyces TaxID=2593676 RepID=UPI0024B97F60|nr:MULTISPECIES: SHOCT domain-containing protein [unclassified Streptomyces]MDJ0342894.1 SHOCT domain-containing protein [Streptomyces sp. PH10-H1]MDJ0372667.1 SHOCT domain-containing protein [Streptomyces sp. H10-C2]